MPAPERRRIGLELLALLVAIAVAGGVVFWASSRDQGPPPAVEQTESTDAPPPPPPGVTLRSLARERGIAIGTAVNAVPLQNGGPYAETLAREFDVVTPENALKWSVVQPERGRFDFTQAEALARAADASGQQIRGHTLVWHRSNPEWLANGDFSRDELIAILRDHIATVVGHFRGRITQWDVVNEAIDENGKLRRSFWREEIGPDYIALAFRFAREADPDAKLYYNDVGAETSDRKSDAILDLVDDLRRDGVPIDGVGFEAHLSERFDDHDTFRRAMDEVAERNLDIAITELDVRMRLDPDGSYDATGQARLYRDIVEMCLERRRCRTLVMWGFTDASSWIPDRYPGWGAATLYDEDFRPKPAYASMAAALRP